MTGISAVPWIPGLRALPGLQKLPADTNVALQRWFSSCFPSIDLVIKTAAGLIQQKSEQVGSVTLESHKKL